MSQTFCAIDVVRAAAILHEAGSLSSAITRDISVSDLPVTEKLSPDSTSGKHYVLSWRWDVDDRDKSSRNLTAAIAHAFDLGVEHLFLDKVSVDQSLEGFALMEAVSKFTDMFCRLPVIAAYDSKSIAVDNRHFLRVLRRPWIAREVLAMRRNPSEIHYVSHISGQGADESFGFQHMVERVWTTSFVHSLLYVLVGYSGMHDVSELALIMPEHANTLDAAVRIMTREDALMTAAILSQVRVKDHRINGDINIRQLNMKYYDLEQTEGSPGFWGNWNVLLNHQRVALWSEKDYTRDGSPRRKFATVAGADAMIANFLGIESLGSTAGNTMAGESSEGHRDLDTLKMVDLSTRFRE